MFHSQGESVQEIKHKGIVSLKAVCIQHFKRITVSGKDWQREPEKMKDVGQVCE